MVCEFEAEARDDGTSIFTACALTCLLGRFAAILWQVIDVLLSQQPGQAAQGSSLLAGGSGPTADAASEVTSGVTPTAHAAAPAQPPPTTQNAAVLTPGGDSLGASGPMGIPAATSAGVPPDLHPLPGAPVDSSPTHGQTCAAPASSISLPNHVLASQHTNPLVGVSPALRYSSAGSSTVELRASMEQSRSSTSNGTSDQLLSQEELGALLGRKQVLLVGERAATSFL